MYTNTVTKLENINFAKIKKGAKVIDMAEAKKNINRYAKVNNKSFTKPSEAEPTEAELREIAEDEKVMSDIEDALLNVDSNDVNVFGKDEAYFYYKQVGNIKVCTPEEEVEYFKKIAAGDMKARDEFVERNLKLVLSNAKYRNLQNPTFSLMDLIQEGNIGLLKAIERFDVTKGYKFSTYATWWIRQAMHRGIADQARTIRVPVHMIEWINRYKKTEREFTQANGYEPSLLEMSKELGISFERTKEIAKRCEEPVSLSAPVGEEEDSTLGDFIQSEDLPIEEQYEQKELKFIVNELLDRLTPKERKIVEARFGIGTGQPQTLEEVGKMFNVTRERIRQIEAKALRKLKRCPSRVVDTSSLKSYLD